ncbi:MAG: hypothetical protein MUQ30_15375, partial [Anaerolineae bacterium]|nr:hypothetical protein [Anaerolineae bacterium]
MSPISDPHEVDTMASAEAEATAAVEKTAAAVEEATAAAEEAIASAAAGQILFLTHQGCRSRFESAALSLLKRSQEIH